MNTLIFVKNVWRLGKFKHDILNNDKDSYHEVGIVLLLLERGSTVKTDQVREYLILQMSCKENAIFNLLCSQINDALCIFFQEQGLEDKSSIHFAKHWNQKL